MSSIHSCPYPLSDDFPRNRCVRLLAHLTVNVENLADAPALSYNERMLEEGMAAPYFIWPNLDPFKKWPTLIDAVPALADMTTVAASGRLKHARDLVAAAATTKKVSSDRIPCDCSYSSCDYSRANAHPAAG